MSQVAEFSESGPLLDRFFSVSLDSLYVAGFDGRFRWVNPALERTLGYSEAELLTIGIVDLCHPDDAAALQAVLSGLARGQNVASFTNRYRHHDGAYRTFTWTGTPVLNEGYFYGIARDETVRLRLEALERERARLDGALLAARTMLHELSNHLALTVGYAEILAGDPRLPGDLGESASQALEGAQRAVAALLRLQRITHLREIDGGLPGLTVLDIGGSSSDRLP